MAELYRTRCNFPRSTILRPVRVVRLTACSPVDKWAATLDVMSHLGVSFCAPLPADEVMCELYVCIHETIGGMVYRLMIKMYDPHVGFSGFVALDRHQGSPADSHAPLWTRRLSPSKSMRFSQPRTFATQLVVGMTNIKLYTTASTKALSWARDASIGTPAHRRIASHCKTVALRKMKVWARGENLRNHDLL